MEKVLIVFGHEDCNGSFNAAMKHSAVEILGSNGLEVKVSNVYELKFALSSIKGEHKNDTENDSSCEHIEQERVKVTWADTIIYQSPMHNVSFPAVVAGWNSKVLAPYHAKINNNGLDSTPMKGKQVLLSLTFGGPESLYTDRGMFGDINVILYPMMKWLQLCGFSLMKPQLSFCIQQGHNKCTTDSMKNWKARLGTLHREQTLANFTLPNSCFTPSGVLKEKSMSEYASAEFGPNVGQHLGKRPTKVI